MFAKWIKFVLKRKQILMHLYIIYNNSSYAGSFENYKKFDIKQTKMDNTNLFCVFIYYF